MSIRDWLGPVPFEGVRPIVLASILIFFVVSGSGPAAAQTATIVFVQGNYAVPQPPQATATVAFPAAQTAGNLNVVVIGWKDSKASITSVTDTKGNTYTLAVGPTVRSAKATHGLSYRQPLMRVGAGQQPAGVAEREDEQVDHRLDVADPQ